MLNDVNPEMLILARELRGITQTELAETSKIPQGTISMFESGLTEVSAETLTILGDILGFPSEFFYRQGHRYNDEGNELFYRKRRSLPTSQLKRIRARLNKFRLDVDRLIENVNVEPPFDIPTYRVKDFNGNIEEIALLTRHYWRLPKGPIENVMEVLESCSCVVIEADFRTDQIDEVVQWVEPAQPVMLVNSRAPGDRLRFSLAHAIGHLVMHHGLPFDPIMEKEADQFAAAFLMPRAQIEPHLQNVTIESMAELKQEWKVSIQSLIHRAHDLNKISEQRYESLFQMLSRKGYRKKEPYPLAVERAVFFEELLDFYINELNYTSSDLARLLNLHLQDFVDWYQPGRPTIRLVPKGKGDSSNDYLPSG